MSCASMTYSLTRWSWRDYQARTLSRYCWFTLWLFPNRASSKCTLRRDLLSLPFKLPFVEKNLSFLSIISGFAGIALPLVLLIAATQSTCNLILGISKSTTSLNSSKSSMKRSINCQRSIICRRSTGNSGINILHISLFKSLVMISKTRSVEFFSNSNRSWSSKNRTNFLRWLLSLILHRTTFIISTQSTKNLSVSSILSSTETMPIIFKSMPRTPSRHTHLQGKVMQEEQLYTRLNIFSKISQSTSSNQRSISLHSQRLSCRNSL